MQNGVVAFDSRAVDAAPALNFIKQHAQVAHVGAGGTGRQRIADRLQQREGVAAQQVLVDVEAGAVGARHGRAVDDRARGRAVAVDAIGAGAQHHDRLAGDAARGGERKLLVAAAGARRSRQRHAEFAGGDHGDPTLRVPGMQGLQAGQQRIERLVDGLVVDVDGVVDEHAGGAERPGHKGAHAVLVGDGDEAGGGGDVRRQQRQRRHRAGAYTFLQPRRQVRQQVEAVEIGGERIGARRQAHRRPRGDVGERAGHVLDHDRVLAGRLLRRQRQATALDQGQPAAHAVDVVDRRAAADQGAVEVAPLVDAHAVVEWGFEQRRTTAGDEEDDVVVVVGGATRRQG